MLSMHGDLRPIGGITPGFKNASCIRLIFDSDKIFLKAIYS
jgi:hypothetical protein